VRGIKPDSGPKVPGLPGLGGGVAKWEKKPVREQSVEKVVVHQDCFESNGKPIECKKKKHRNNS